MSLRPVPRSLPLPALPPAPPRGGIPVLASLVPIGAAGVLWAVTGSASVLLFALLGPALAIGAALDRGFRSRRLRRRALAALIVRAERVEAEVSALLDGERDRLDRRAPAASSLATIPPARLWNGGDDTVVRLGTARLPSGVTWSVPEETPDETPVAAVARLRDRTCDRTVPVLVDVGGGVAVVGPVPVAAAVARSLLLQLWSRDVPGRRRVRHPLEESWVTALAPAEAGTPGEYELVDQDGGALRVGWGDDDSAAPPGTGVVLRLPGPDGASASLDAGAGAREQLPDFRADAIAAEEAERIAWRLGSLARRGGAALPDRIGWADLPAPAGGVLPAVLGAGRDGPVTIDLAVDGPHAVVGGTTGAGKSELLVTWVLGIAAARSPAQVAFLLVDFKGGAAFAPLESLPHVAGIVTDLDGATTRRAATSLRAELRRRERLLAERGAGAIDQLPDGALARLVVVIDEYAALVGENPELHDIVADVAARGRSLGVHLILCTQRPAGVVRDGVLANASLRLSLRVTTPADSAAVLGSPLAADLPREPRGRLAVADADGGVAVVQVARSRSADIAGVAQRWATAERAWRPWAQPPPSRVPWETVAGTAGGFGLADLPEQQATPVSDYRPERDGNVLVLGGRGAGVTAALAALAAATGQPVAVLPASPADAWDVLARESARASGGVLVADDVDALLADADDETRLELVGMLSAAGRGRRAAGGALLLGASRLPVGASPLLAVVDSRLLLGLPDRDSHVLAGGRGQDWRPRRPGSGLWGEREVQVALAAALPRSAVSRCPRFHPPATAWAVVAPDARAVANALRQRRLPVVEPGGSPPAAGAVTVGDPETWQAEWAALDRARRGPVLAIGLRRREVTTLLRCRDVPPLDPARAEGWLVEDGAATRVDLGWFTGAEAGISSVE